VLGFAFLCTLHGISPPAIAIETDATDAHLRGALIRRLLEEGRAIAPRTTTVAIVVVVRSLRHSVLIEASQAGQTTTAEIDRADPEVMALEVAHATIDAIRRLETAGPTEPPQVPRVALHFVGFEPDPAYFAEATETLLEAGFAVVGSKVSAEWTLCVWREGDRGFVFQRTQASDCPASPPAAAPQPLVAGVKTEANAQAETITEALLNDLQASIEARPAAAPMAIPSAPPATERPRPPRWFEVRVDAGPLFRLQPIDVGANMSLAMGAGHWGGMARVEWMPSLGTVNVLDTAATIGPSVGWNLGQRSRICVQLLGGLLIHRAKFETEPVIHRFDFTASLPLWFDLRIARGLGLHLGASAGIATVTRTHSVGSPEAWTVVWTRSPVRVSVFLGIHYRATWNRRTS